MPIGVQMPKSARAKYQNGIFTITIDATQVVHLLDVVEAAISPYGLYEFAEAFVAPYFSDEIVNRFAWHGDSASGDWAPLSAATRRLRHTLGFSDDFAINERTGEFLHFVAYSNEISMIAGGAWVQIPGPPPDGVLAKKLKTAQHGDVQGAGDMLPGAVTPARPVLAVDAEDMAALVFGLQLHIINYVNTLLGTP